MGGHVFVAHSDITKLACNAWLLPTDSSLSVTERWLAAASKEMGSAFPSENIRRRWKDRKTRAMSVAPWEEGRGTAPSPIPILTDVGGWERSDLAWYCAGVSDFIAEAVRSTADGFEWRGKRLFAIPLVGSGAGGQSHRKGALEAALLECLKVETLAHDVDIVLVLLNKANYDAAQSVRRSQGYLDSTLHPNLRQLIDDLARAAREGRLVIFAGAGLSKSAGLPLWDELLAHLASTAGVSEPEIAALQKMPAVDAASIIEKRLRKLDLSLRELTSQATSATCFGLAHALLAGLPVTERVTTNYDVLIETSLEAIGRPVSVLPYEPTKSDHGWLLKLHGSSAAAFDDIVLTRQDYVRYDSRRGALYGIVQALLLTRHILFLGFSLEDDNFYALVDEVRQALEGVNSRNNAAAKFGTAFVPTGKSLRKELWEDELHMEEIAGFPDYPRFLEIALDYLGCMAATNLSHLLDPSFHDILTEDEKRLKTAVRLMQDELGTSKGPAFDAARRFLHDVGALNPASAPRNLEST